MRLFETNDQAVSWTNTEPADTPEAYVWALRKAKALHHQHEILLAKFKPYAKHLIKGNYRGEFNTPIVPKSQIKVGQYDTYAIPQGTANADKLWEIVQSIGKKTAKAWKMMGKYTRLAAKLKKTYRDETFDALHKVDPKQISPNEVPRRIYYTKDRYFNNPYWDRENVVMRYGGPVAHFPELNAQERVTLVELERTLKKHGLPGMTKAYGTIVKRDRWRVNRFVAFGANDRLIWKRIGSNIVYIDGKKVSISDLTDTYNLRLKEKQDLIFAGLKEPKP